MKARVGERGQITIPKKLRDRLGIHPGEEIDFAEEDGRLVGTRVRRDSPTETVYGILKLPRSVDELINELRGEPDAV